MEQWIGVATCCGGPLFLSGFFFYMGRMYERYQGLPWKIVRRDLEGEDEL